MRRTLILLLALAPMTPSSAGSPDEVVRRHFPEAGACLLVVDAADGRELLRHGGARCATRRSPCSTFKIANALVALDAGVVEGAGAVFAWNGVEHHRAVVNRDHDLSSAMKHSVVWYFQELARRIGRERMQRALEEFDYGNHDSSGGLTRFWLESSLAISPEEQVAFLRRLLAGTLPVTESAAATVRSIVPVQRGTDWVLRGKTGSGRTEDGSLGWYVGWVERGDDRLVFAARVESGEEVWGWHVRDRVLAAFRELGYIGD